MDGIELMVEEQKCIKRILLVIREECYGILKGDDINYDDITMMISFVKHYGMISELDFGRLYLKELEKAVVRVKAGDDESKLDVIANAISYTHLLYRHIGKEDKNGYTFAKREFPNHIIDIIN
ncbi:hemerythrin domain-containing protein [Abyssisolibacter fermentans]|uniref:hemerythrin domain-containing protein n=1 Tax=Abyssisolibacter fermentans TaxID=1766203 RepID=UPI00082A7AFF|nr:hypothetical protein [Abyssisolibacter fermentans]